MWVRQCTGDNKYTYEFRLDFIQGLRKELVKPHLDT